MLEIVKEVDSTQRVAFVDHGWICEDQYRLRQPAAADVAADVATAAVCRYNYPHEGNHNHVYLRPQDESPIYLVQTGRIKEPLRNFRGFSLSKSVDLDYMGSAEFEFGAIRRSLLVMKSLEWMYTLSTIEDTRLGSSRGEKLRIYGAFDTEDTRAKYLEQLVLLRQDKLRTKENARFQDIPNPSIFTPNFWWDIESHVIWSYNKVFMKQFLRSAIEHSFKVIENTWVEDRVAQTGFP